MKNNHDEYITFLLGADAFKICDTIRNASASYGMDVIFETCKYISKKFIEYDKKENKNISTYDSFTNFLIEYEKQIEEYIFDDKEIKIN